VVGVDDFVADVENAVSGHGRGLRPGSVKLPLSLAESRP